MSLTKAGANYARHMDELFAEDDRDYDLEYADWCYHQNRERIEQMEHDKTLNEQTNKPNKP